MKPWDTANLEFDVDAFCGVARLFPLPNLVLYPHVMQPLHVFEDRYREMLEDALASDRLIAMALLEPGWEPDYDSRPPIAPYACLGKIMAHHRLEDGRYNLLLMGVERVRIVRELDPPRAFRRAEVELNRERCLDSSPQHCEELRRQLLSAFQHFLPSRCQVPEQLQELLAEQMPLGMMTDLAAYALPLELQLKRQLLAECRVDVRAQLLIDHLDVQQLAGEPVAALASVFPPPFSTN
jgi:ATP-dependent Lon protease